MSRFLIVLLAAGGLWPSPTVADDRAFPIRADAGYVRDSKGQEAVRLNLNTNEHLFAWIFGDEQGLTDRWGGFSEGVSVLRVSASGTLRADFDAEALKRLEFETPRFGLLAVRHERETVVPRHGREERRKSLVLDWELLTLSYRKDQVDATRTDLSGPLLRIAPTEFQVRGKDGRNPFEAYGKGSCLIEAGEINGSPSRIYPGYEVVLGLGVDLGVIGTLRAEAGYLAMGVLNDERSDDTALQRVTLTARLDKPADLPFAAAVTYSSESATSGGTDSQTEKYEQTAITVGGAY